MMAGKRALIFDLDYMFAPEDEPNDDSLMELEAFSLERTEEIEEFDYFKIGHDFNQEVTIKPVKHLSSKQLSKFNQVIANKIDKVTMNSFWYRKRIQLKKEW